MKLFFILYSQSNLGCDSICKLHFVFCVLGVLDLIFAKYLFYIIVITFWEAFHACAVQFREISNDPDTSIGVGLLS